MAKRLARGSRRVAQIFLFRLSGASRNPGLVVIWAPASAGETGQLKLSD